MASNRTDLLAARDAWCENPTLAQLVYGHIGTWDVSNVQDMAQMFCAVNSSLPNNERWAADCNTACSDFDDDVSEWDMSGVSSTRQMFREAASFNQDIGRWETSRVYNMDFMFMNAASFNQDVGGWETSSVTSMYSMFNRAASFNQDIGRWNVSKVKRMNYMFYGAASFYQNLSAWRVSGKPGSSAYFMFVSSPMDTAYGMWPFQSPPFPSGWTEYRDSFCYSTSFTSDAFVFTDNGGDTWTDSDDGSRPTVSSFDDCFDACDLEPTCTGVELVLVGTDYCWLWLGGVCTPDQKLSFISEPGSAYATYVRNASVTY